MGPHIDFYLLQCNKFQVLGNLHQLYSLVLQLLVRVLDKKLNLFLMFKVLKIILNSYVIHSLQNKDLLYSPAYMCKCLYDFELHNQHWQHSCKDLHIFHFDMLELLGILDQSNTRKVCILCKGFLCVQVDIGTLQNDYSLCKMP